MKKKRTIAAQAAARGPLPELSQELLDELVKGPMTAFDWKSAMSQFAIMFDDRFTQVRG